MEDREQQQAPTAGEMYNKVRVRQFMNILEQLPRLCSPTICGTLSQPTTRTERNSRGADLFEWSLEQKAILSPANITTDTDATDDWQQNVADLNPSWRQQESEMFFSQRTIAPSPMIQTPARVMRKPVRSNFQDLMLEEDEGSNTDEDEERAAAAVEAELEDGQGDDSDSQLEAMDDSFERMIDRVNNEPHEGDQEDEQAELDDYDEELNDDQDDDQDMDNLFFSPRPLASSQTQQRMDVFSPDSFVRVMDDDNTLQSTPKTTGSLQRTTRPRTGVLD